MYMKYVMLAALTAAVGVLAPTAQANHQEGDVPFDVPGGTVRAEPVAPLEPGGFDWSDAAVGAAFALGAALVVLGLALLARRPRSRPAEAA
jgi:hypothetical protein